MKIYSFLFPAQDNDQPVVKHTVAGCFEDALAVASEKGLSGFTSVNEGPEVVAVAGMFE